MEGRINAMERWASEQSKMMIELQGNMTLIQEGLFELEEKLKDPKKVDEKSEGSENLVNGEERKERSIKLGIISISAGAADQNVEPTRKRGKTGVDSMGRRRNRSNDMRRCNNHS